MGVFLVCDDKVLYGATDVDGQWVYGDVQDPNNIEKSTLAIWEDKAWRFDALSKERGEVEEWPLKYYNYKSTGNEEYGDIWFSVIEVLVPLDKFGEEARSQCLNSKWKTPREIARRILGVNERDDPDMGGQDWVLKAFKIFADNGLSMFLLDEEEEQDVEREKESEEEKKKGDDDDKRNNDDKDDGDDAG